MAIDMLAPQAELVASGTSDVSVAQPAAAIAMTANLREFLVWVARCPRSYAEAMEAWRSSCPRFTIWEDALAADLVQLEVCRASSATEQRVCLTPIGKTLLAST